MTRNIDPDHEVISLNGARFKAGDVELWMVENMQPVAVMRSGRTLPLAEPSNDTEAQRQLDRLLAVIEVRPNEVKLDVGPDHSYGSLAAALGHTEETPDRVKCPQCGRDRWINQINDEGVCGPCQEWNEQRASEST